MKKGTWRCEEDSYTKDGAGYKMRGTWECGMDGGVRMFISRKKRPSFACGRSLAARHQILDVAREWSSLFCWKKNGSLLSGQRGFTRRTWHDDASNGPTKNVIHSRETIHLCLVSNHHSAWKMLVIWSGFGGTFARVVRSWTSSHKKWGGHACHQPFNSSLFKHTQTYTPWDCAATSNNSTTATRSPLACTCSSHGRRLSSVRLPFICHLRICFKKLVKRAKNSAY